MINPLDEVLDELENLTADCPKPMIRTHCDYCLTWVVIMEDILKVNDDQDELGRCDTCKAQYELGSRHGRCGDCGDCGKCCEHMGDISCVMCLSENDPCDCNQLD